MSNFDESAFRTKVDEALTTVKKILDNTRDPKLPADVPHQYDDKYALAEYITKTTLAAQLNVLEVLGVSGEQLTQMIEWGRKKSVTIRFKAEETCTFIRKEKVKIENPVAHQTEVKVAGLNVAKLTGKSYTKVMKYYWNFEANYAVFAYRGTDLDKPLVFQGRKASCELLVQDNEAPPYKEVVVRPTIEFNISWLLKHLRDGKMDFHIDRAAKTCRTPRRNAEINEAFSQCGLFHDWCDNVRAYFLHTLFPVEQEHGLDLSALHTRNVFNPILPLFEEKNSQVIQAGDLGPFLAEQTRSLNERRNELLATFPPPTPASAPASPPLSKKKSEKKGEKQQPNLGKLISNVEAQLVVTVLHGAELLEAFTEGIEYIEHMLYTQLTAAIGKILSPLDFANYMAYHQRKLFRAEQAPKGFSYAVRRPDHYPEGTVALESNTSDGKMSDPVPTLVRSFPAEKPMRFPLDAATQVSFSGERHVHAWVNQTFSGIGGQTLQLVARARQFSSYVLLVGRISSATLFDPKFGIIIQNKDDLRIPLLMETIPTPKEFADAIESLSPEQQRFCRAFRSMQLESTLFGVVVIQIKPQLERLLRLPDDSLTKEIRLTQDLLNLFIEYNIPADLLSYAGPGDLPVEAKLTEVQRYVTEMRKMIEEAKKDQLKEATEKAQARAAEHNVLLNAQLKPMSLDDAPQPMPEKRMPSKKGGFHLSLRRNASPPASRSAAPPPSPSAMASVSLAAAKVADSPAEPAPPAPVPEPSSDKKEPEEVKGAAELDSEEVNYDFTQVPSQLDAAFSRLDEDAALRPTILNVGPVWTKSSQKGLLSKPQSNTLSTVEQQAEKAKAWDLLDALTRSGSLPVEQATLHVVVAATHTFAKSLIDTVVQDNVNPIEKVERSLLIVASVLFGQTPADLTSEDEVDRVRQFSPGLFK